MSFGTAVGTGFRKYVTFTGRASRAEFWWWMLFQVLVTVIPILIAVVFLALGSSSGSGGSSNGALVAIAIVLYVAGFLVALALVLPTLAVGCRRLHDRGTSGWLQLLLIVPCGNFVLLIFWLLPGTAGDNVYGAPSA